MNYLDLLAAPVSVAEEAIEFSRELGMYREWREQSQAYSRSQR
jgi:hypothetical protein